MFNAVAPSKPLRYQRLDDDDDDVLNSRNLTASLRKLCMWERKLYDEVKVHSDFAFTVVQVTCLCCIFSFPLFMILDKIAEQGNIWRMQS